MMHYSTYGHMTFMSISQIAILILFFLIFWWVMKNNNNCKNQSAAELLDKRLANGEITIEEHKKIKKEISE